MKSIKEQIQNSTCYGVAFDAAVKECKMCELKTECKLRMEGEKALKPSSPIGKVKEKVEDNIKKDNPKTTVSTPKTVKPKDNGNALPDFKAMDLEELEKLAQERGADDKWKKYDNPGIRRMRLTMALKKTY